MNVSWDTILNAIGELDRLHSANETKFEISNKIKDLCEQTRSLKRALSAEKEVLEKKLKEAAQGEKRLWELLDKKNEETILLDQSLVQAENEQSRLRDLFDQETSRITELEKVSQDMKAAHKEATQENQLLLLQLHKAQEELETQFLSQKKWELLDKKNEEKIILLEQSLVQAENEQSRLRDLLAQETSRISEMKKVSQEMEAAHKEAAQENQLLLLQLHKAQEELETLFSSQKKDDIRVKQLRNEIARMQQTLSWRVTSPLRWVMWNFYKKNKCD